MSRSGYTEDFENWATIMYRGQVASAIRGKRGQAFLQELAEALDAMPSKRLIPNELKQEGEVCTLGAIGVKRGITLEALDPEDPDTLAEKFGIAQQLIREIEWENDEGGYDRNPEERWERMRRWVASKIKKADA
jgi:hypothetical protein